MPIDETLPDLDTPSKIKWGEKPKLDMREHYQSIKVSLLSYPTMKQLLSYIPEYGTATWADEPSRVNFPEEVIEDLFAGNLLPTSMETIRLTFLLEGLDVFDITHILRHRRMAFSAQCTADRDMRHDKILIKPSIAHNDKFRDRFVKLMEDAMQLYSDMVDSKEVSILDARTVVPRCTSAHYYMSGSLMDFIAFIKQRLDRQIQPMSDNLIAIQMLWEIVKVYPLAKQMVDIDSPDMWYIKTAPTGRSTNAYPPETKNDIFPWKPQWFIYDKCRDEFEGAEVFEDLWNHYKDNINGIK